MRGSCSAGSAQNTLLGVGQPRPSALDLQHCVQAHSAFFAHIHSYCHHVQAVVYLVNVKFKSLEHAGASGRMIAFTLGDELQHEHFTREN